MRVVEKPVVALALLVFTLVFSACPQRQSDAKETASQFLNDIRARRGDAAFARLSEGSQTELRRRHLALVKAGGGEPDVAPAYLIFKTLDVELLSTPESIVEASRPDGAEVLLRVSVKSGESADLRMVRENDAWKVDLFRSLAPTSARDDAMDPETE